MAKIYAVKKGLKPGLYYNWPDCQAVIKGYSGAEYKSFMDENEAIAYLGGFNTNTKEESNIIPCKKDRECNVFVMGSFDYTLNKGGFGIQIETKSKTLDFYQGVLPQKGEKGSVTYSELIACLTALQLAKQLGYSVIRLYSNQESIVNWAEHVWVPKDKLKLKFCDYCDLLQKDKTNTVSFFTLKDNYKKKSLKVLSKRGLLSDTFIDTNMVMTYDITVNNLVIL